MKRIFMNLKNLFKKKHFITILFISFIVLFILFLPLKKVEIGDRGILYDNIQGQVTNILKPGWHFVIPITQELTSYPITEKSYVIARDSKNWSNGIDASITTPSSDNQTLSIDVSFQYYLDQNKLEYIYEKYDGKEILEIEKTYLKDIFKDSIIHTVSQYTAYDVYSTKRKEIQNNVLDILRRKLEGSGIMINDTFINNVRLSEEMNSIIKAKAVAKAAVIEAEGKSAANKLINDSLSNKIMQYESLSKLSESLKLVIVPSDSNTQLDFSKILEQMLEDNAGDSTNISTK
ncbi:MAG: spfh domain / band 7 family protein [Herbinix sp.]|jgi:regulator of protease activity HflC (stomatin/prohibitin superfamily)|nr:spfh domain / band 7 family protein [Herbinix sp.]